MAITPKHECCKCGGPMWRQGKAGSGKQRWTCRLCGFRTTSPELNKTTPAIDSAAVKAKVSGIVARKKTDSIQRYVVTSAQNNTPIHKGFHAAILHYCNRNNAELLVIPIRYQNPTSWNQAHPQDAYWYPEAIAGEIVNKQISLSRTLEVRGDIKIQATAADPLSGLETISGTKSAIFGHGQIRLKMVATPQDKLPKMLHTTGSISTKNYSDTKQGAKGRHHHSLGAVVVEVVGDKFHIREIVAEHNGAFYDLDMRYTADGVEPSPGGIEALITGDEHALLMDPSVRLATYDSPNSIINTLKPRKIIRHDVLDFYSQNHHHKKNVITRYVKLKTGRHDVRKELDDTLQMIEETTPRYAESIIIASNHNNALLRWLNEYRADLDPYNAPLYFELASKVFDQAKWTQNGVWAPDPFAVYAEGRLGCRHRFVSSKESYLIKGIDVSQHGHIGVNGARGSINGFAASEYKMVTGHSHTPGIRYGCYQVGTSSYLNLEYNTGLSSWLQSHCIIYPNGKRTLVHIMGGDWRA